MKRYLPYILIIAVLVVAAGFYVSRHSNLKFGQNNPVSHDQQSAGDNSMQIDFKNQGQAPDFVGIDKWLNTSGALSTKDLKGKVVLVDFWTFSCINCIRTLPYVTKWYDTYKDQGFVVVGVHTPEFPFEKVTSNVQDAINRYGIHYPVAQDNEYATWNNYNNQFWPAEYLINKDGDIVYTHFGEGNYDRTGNAIRELLGLNTQQQAAPNSNLDQVGSPEMYFGTARLQNLTSEQKASASTQDYNFPQTLSTNYFALQGSWQFNPEYAELTKPNGAIRLKFHAAKIYMVAQSAKPVHLKIKVDGQDQPDVVVSASQLYTLFDSSAHTDHTIELSIPDPGFEAYTFTFG
jgi:thiol-disulfide isomerase/thioredoxin